MEKCIERLKLFLSENGVKYEIQRHREVFTAQAVAAELHEKGSHVAKVVIVWADGKKFMLVLPAPAHVDFDRAQAMLSADDVRQAREEEFGFLFPDCDLGAMPPFGNLYDIPVYLDRSLTAAPDLVFQAGSHRETMKIPTADYLRLVSPSIGDFALQTRAAPAAA